MAGHEKDAYLALIAARDPQSRALLDQGFAFVTNAFDAHKPMSTEEVHVVPVHLMSS